MYDSTTVIIAVAFTLPIGWLFYLNTRNSKRIDEMHKSSYTKPETTEMIELHNRPILQAVEGLSKDINEIKHLIVKLFDAQAK